jgi:hypothetical protein
MEMIAATKSEANRITREREMTVTYTNRKGRTYTLCQGLTKSGKPRYYFAREPKGVLVQEIPEGYEIRESVNAIVSLAKIRPTLIRPEELATVEATLERHPRSRNYRIRVKGTHIVVYETVGPDHVELATALGLDYLLSPSFEDRMRSRQEQHAQFTPVLRFILVDAETREFEAQRWCYLGRIDDWITLYMDGPLEQLAARTIRTLGSDEFFDLH